MTGEVPVAALIARRREPARKSKLRRAEGAIKTSNKTPKLNVMTKMMLSRALSAAALAAAFFVSAASAQTGKNYDVKTMNFDLWCQEQAHLPATRCDKRTPEDESNFESYRAQIERYEVPYLQQQQRELSINRDIMHNDPIDNPATRNPQGQSQDPNRQPPVPQP